MVYSEGFFSTLQYSQLSEKAARKKFIKTIENFKKEDSHARLESGRAKEISPFLS